MAHLVPNSINPWMEYCATAWFIYKDKKNKGFLDLLSFHTQQQFEDRFFVSYRALYNYTREDESKRLPLYRLSNQRRRSYNGTVKRYYTYLDLDPSIHGDSPDFIVVKRETCTLGSEAAQHGSTNKSSSTRERELAYRPQNNPNHLSLQESGQLYRHCAEFASFLRHSRFSHTRIYNELQQLMRVLVLEKKLQIKNNPNHLTLDETSQLYNKCAGFAALLRRYQFSRTPVYEEVQRAMNDLEGRHPMPFRNPVQLHWDLPVNIPRGRVCITDEIRISLVDEIRKEKETEARLLNGNGDYIGRW